MTSSDAKNSNKKEATNGLGSTWKPQLFSAGRQGNTERMTANGQAGISARKSQTEANRPTESAPLSITENLEMTDITSGEDIANYQVIRMKDHMQGGTYL